MRKNWQNLNKQYEEFSKQNNRAFYPWRTRISQEEREKNIESLDITKKDDIIKGEKNRIELFEYFDKAPKAKQMDINKQNKHYVDEKEYQREIVKGNTKSYFIIDKKELEDFVKEKIGTGDVKKLDNGSYREVLTFNKKIGVVTNLDGKKEEVYQIKVHYSKTGYHAVPKKRR